MEIRVTNTQKLSGKIPTWGVAKVRLVDDQSGTVEAELMQIGTNRFMFIDPITHNRYFDTIFENWEDIYNEFPSGNQMRVEVDYTKPDDEESLW